MKEFEYQLSIIEYELQEAKLQNKGYADVEFIADQLKTSEKEVREQQSILSNMHSKAVEL